MKHELAETPPAPESAQGVFASSLPTAEAYCRLLAEEATVRGLIGPREVPRLWDRHVLNCAVVTDVMAEGARVADIGSGAGLPGLVIAIRRPDLSVTLIEPLLRRTTFLEEAVERLGLTNVTVLRGRAEEFHGKQTFDVVTSRAVAPLDRLARWSLPLVADGGEMVAMKGSSAPEEITAAASVLKKLGGVSPRIETLGTGTLEQPVTVVRIGRRPR